MRLKDKVILVTGARKGIGETVALALAKEGADLALVSRSIRDDSDLVKEVKALGRKVFVKRVDIGDRAQVFAMVDDILKEFGRIDVLFNNAGISRPVMLWNTTEEDWEDIIRINLTGTFYCIQAVAKPMMEQRSGSIINITSAAGLVGTIGQVNYTAAKGGTYAMAKSAAKELARYGIRVNTICPLAETDMTAKIAHDPKLSAKYLERIPLGRFAQPEEVSPAVIFFASDESSIITGQTLCIDGGMVML
ncbi:MAG TPA: SDR family oxidoreductase [Firmicutes bacterium]|nr:SDR family oxidoreductase [Bacillota bacterium]